MDRQQVIDRQQVQLLDLLRGIMKVSAVYTAAKLDIADKLKDSPKSFRTLRWPKKQAHMNTRSTGYCVHSQVLAYLLR